jgi:hypothetical protein
LNGVRSSESTMNPAEHRPRRPQQSHMLKKACKSGNFRGSDARSAAVPVATPLYARTGECRTVLGPRFVSKRKRQRIGLEAVDERERGTDGSYY